MKACKEELGIGFGETTADGEFTLLEVECAGACVNAPVIAYKEDYYEDLKLMKVPRHFIEVFESWQRSESLRTAKWSL